jgi:hypothetical protein
MNLYFLVEGQAELVIYPKWLDSLLPSFTQVKRFDRVEKNNYFIFGGFGIPSIIYDHLPNAITDINSVENYNYLILCIDAEELAVNERIEEIHKFLENSNHRLKKAELIIIVQNRCIETWLLGNQNIFPGHELSGKLKAYVDFYHVRFEDPEMLGKYQGFSTHAQFHKSYLKEICKVRNMRYSGIYPKDVLAPFYLDELKKRVRLQSDHLKTFQSLTQFCQSVESKIVV